ncbi:hypothetical protein ABW19_dt0202304 [Dactylella cylindrospora]|nr:hypothetical protein ABW19_dt0202304 [Dactylella cylindrospora]
MMQSGFEWYPGNRKGLFKYDSILFDTGLANKCTSFMGQYHPIAFSKPKPTYYPPRVEPGWDVKLFEDAACSVELNTGVYPWTQKLADDWDDDDDWFEGFYNITQDVGDAGSHPPPPLPLGSSGDAPPGAAQVGSTGDATSAEAVLSVQPNMGESSSSGEGYSAENSGGADVDSGGAAVSQT